MSIPLALDVSRCEPADCTAKTKCARWLAHIGPRSPVSDLSKDDISGGSALCSKFIHVDTLRKA